MKRKVTLAETKLTNVDLLLKPALYIKATVTDKQGNQRVVLNEKAKSFVSNFAAMLFQLMGRNNRLPEIVQTAGTTRGWGRNELSGLMDMSLSSGYWNVNQGICVGTSNTPVSWSQFHLQDPIPNGSSSGELVYDTSHNFSEPVITNYGSPVTDSDSVIKVSRVFTNNSGADIDIKEVGIFSRFTTMYFYHIGHPTHEASTSTAPTSTGSQNESYMMVRDVLTTPITVGIGSFVTIEYAIKTEIELATGGFTHNFNRLMYRHFMGRSFAVECLKGGTYTTSSQNYGFLAASQGAKHFVGAQNYSLHYHNNCHPDEFTQGEGLGVVIGLSDDIHGGINSNDLHTRIKHGTGTNQMLLYGSFVHNYVATPGDMKAEWDCERVCVNRSGSSITVKEAGLTCMLSSSRICLIARDILPSPVTVLDGDGIRVRYKFIIAE